MSGQDNSSEKNEQNSSSAGSFIDDIVDKATDSMNFERLSQDISDSIQTVFKEIGINTNISDHIKQQGSGGSTGRTASSRTGAAGIRQPREVPVAVRNPKGTLSGIILTALGATFTSIFALSEFVVIMLGATIRQFAGAGTAAAIVLLPFLVISIFVLVTGARMNGRVKRFKKYLKQIGDRKFCSINELARSTGKSDKYTAADLQKMISKNFFTNAHIDEAGTTLMLDEDSYQQYLRSMNQYHQRVLQEEENSRAFSTDGSGKNDELDQALAEGKKYFDQIHKANEAVSDQAFSDKLSRMEELVKKIFEVIKQKPDQLHKLRRFMQYYMPITVKLLNAYTQLDSQPENLENVQTSKKEIEDTVDTINYAYEKLLNSFFEESAIDISSDISVLQSMFAQEGLSPDPFETDTPDASASSGDTDKAENI